uniref:Secreted protein n=1 Tax=Arundo donax TaxID=35708 RepID=A0A0A8XQC0_ARUDO
MSVPLLKSVSLSLSLSLSLERLSHVPVQEAGRGHLLRQGHGRRRLSVLMYSDQFGLVWTRALHSMLKLS